MPFSPRSFLPAAALLFTALFETVPMRAQTALCVEDHGKLAVVRRANGTTAFVEDHGKWIDYPNGPFVLHPVKNYAPILIGIHNRSFQKGERAVSDDGPSPAHLVNAGRFVFLANLTSPIDLDDVVLALELGPKKREEMQLYLHGIGHLEAHKSQRISLDVVTSFRLRDIGLKRIHVYVRGQEALNTEIPGADRKAALDRLVASRLEHSADGPARPLLLLDPVYPPKLEPRAKGEVVLQCDVGVNGRATHPVVVRASRPELVAAAEEALHESRFIPAVKEGVPVASPIVVPFEIDPAW
jgi:hypothetical protein